MPKNHKKTESDLGSWVSFGRLINSALENEKTEPGKKEDLRQTWSKKEYRIVFPKALFQESENGPGAEGSRNVRLLFCDNGKGECFVRNLWFAHNFFSKPAEVIEFLAGATHDRIRIFQRRLAELEGLKSSYDDFVAKGARIRTKLKAFDPIRMDLLAIRTRQSPSKVQSVSSSFSPSAAIADLIRGIEERASYKAGNPVDACEKALYFYELGHSDIANSIVDDVRMRNPDSSEALFTKAVLLLNAADKHASMAFQHDVMFPSDLEPLDSEEFWHRDQANEQRHKAVEAAEESFQLLLKARLNWPENFRLRFSHLEPAFWQYRIEEFLLGAAVSRVSSLFAGIRCPPSLSDVAETTQASKKSSDQIRRLIEEVSKSRGRSLFSACHASTLCNLLIIASRLSPELGKNCLATLQSVLDSGEMESKVYRNNGRFQLPFDKGNEFADALYEQFGNGIVYQALRRLVTPETLSSLLERIETQSTLYRQDQILLRDSFAARAWILAANAEGLGICEKLLEKWNWPSTELGQTLRRCWRYSYVLLLLEASCAAFNNNNKNEAVKSAEKALANTELWFDDLKGEKPLLQYDDGEDFVPKDWLHGEPNIITDPDSYGFWLNDTVFFSLKIEPVPEQFQDWMKGNSEQLPFLSAYATWLADQPGGNKLKPLIQSLAALRENSDGIRSVPNGTN
jgi:hypothetical protein